MCSHSGMTLSQHGMAASRTHMLPPSRSYVPASVAYEMAAFLSVCVCLYNHKAFFKKQQHIISSLHVYPSEKKEERRVKEGRRHASSWWKGRGIRLSPPQPSSSFSGNDVAAALLSVGRILLLSALERKAEGKVVTPMTSSKADSEAVSLFSSTWQHVSPALWKAMRRITPGQSWHYSGKAEQWLWQNILIYGYSRTGEMKTGGRLASFSSHLFFSGDPDRHVMCGWQAWHSLSSTMVKAGGHVSFWKEKESSNH